MVRLNAWGSVCVLGLAGLAALLLNVKTTAQAPSANYVNFEGAQTNPIRLSPDGARLFAVNTANASLSVFDLTQPANPALITEIPVGLEPVSVSPLSGDLAWVVNHLSNSISVVSVSQGMVVNTINLKALSTLELPLVEPMDVVFVGSQAYVSVSRANAIAVFDTNSLNLLATVPVFGGNPRNLAVSPDGSTVYASFALAGNATTIISNGVAPPQSPPTNPALPPPPSVGLIVKASDPAWKKQIKFKMPQNGVVAISTGASPAVKGYYSAVGTDNLGLAVNPQNGDLWVANTDSLNLTHFETNLLGHYVNNRITQISVANGTVTPYDLNPNLDYTNLPNPASLASALAQPYGVAFDPSGAFMYVAAFGTDRIAKVDTGGHVLSFVEVSLASGSGSNVDPANKRGPRGLALNSAGTVMYALNRISNTISVIDASQSVPALTTEIAVGNDPTPLTVKQGRGFMYDAKLSGSGTGSCASCHIDGDMDHLAWDLGNPAGDMGSYVQNGVTILFHPMKGPMTTQTLRGLANLQPYHWRGDKPVFQAFNGAFPGLMGSPSISTDNMNTYTTFVNNTYVLPNPYQNLDRTMPNSLFGGNPNNGFTAFMTVPGDVHHNTCNACHTASNAGTNQMIRLVNSSTQPIKVAQLRNNYQKTLFTQFSPMSIDGYGLGHNGKEPSFIHFDSAAVFPHYTQQERIDMAAYAYCFDTGVAPAVGYTRTLLASNVTTQPMQNDWKTLQTRAGAGDIDLTVRGTIQGAVHGLLYQPLTTTYISDGGVSYTQAQLQNFVTGGDTLTIMGVYPGTGTTSIVHRKK